MINLTTSPVPTLSLSAFSALSSDFQICNLTLSLSNWFLTSWTVASPATVLMYPSSIVCPNATDVIISLISPFTRLILYVWDVFPSSAVTTTLMIVLPAGIDVSEYKLPEI